MILNKFFVTNLSTHGHHVEILPGDACSRMPIWYIARLQGEQRMPRSAKTARELEHTCANHGWARAPRYWFYDPDEVFTRGDETVRVLLAAMLGGPSNIFLIDHITPAWRKLWHVRLGAHHREPWKKLVIVPHVILKCQHGKPEYTLNRYIIEHFLTRQKKPRITNVELLMYDAQNKILEYPKELKNLENGY